MLRALSTLPLTALLLTACGTENHSSSPAAAPSPSSSATSDAVETAGPEERVAVSYDGGVLVVRAEDGEVLLDEAVEGYPRLSPAGDERHVMIAAAGGFTALD